MAAIAHARDDHSQGLAGGLATPRPQRAAFDHMQTRHSRHHRPVRLRVKD